MLAGALLLAVGTDTEDGSIFIFPFFIFGGGGLFQLVLMLTFFLVLVYFVFNSLAIVLSNSNNIEEMILCRKCGRTMSADATYCSACGSKGDDADAWSESI